MVKLPWGFSPWQATQQLVDDLNPFDGGSRDRDIFSDRGNQIMGRDQNAPEVVTEQSVPEEVVVEEPEDTQE